MEAIGAALQRKRVEVHTYYHICIIRKERNEIVIYLILLILQLVELRELKGEVDIVHSICDGVV